MSFLGPTASLGLAVQVETRGQPVGRLGGLVLRSEGMDGDSRRSDRHRVRFKLVYDDGESYHAGQVRDLSDSGVFLETHETLPIGTRVLLSSIEVDEDHGFDLPARVVRVVEPGPDRLHDDVGMGLEFLDLDEKQRIFLQGLIERLEDEARQFEGAPDPWLGKRVPGQGMRRAASGVWRSPPGDGKASSQGGAPAEPRGEATDASGSADEDQPSGA